MSITVKQDISVSALKKDVRKDYPNGKLDAVRNLLTYKEGDTIPEPTAKERALISAVNDSRRRGSKATENEENEDTANAANDPKPKKKGGTS